jgi:uncharacterized membrane protein YphA (DoxX/SURF4 family)
MGMQRWAERFVGGLILSTGVMKLAVPKLRWAWGAQLDQAGLPFRHLTYHVFPLVEIGVGGMLIVGVLPGTNALIVVGMMAGATVVHFLADDPEVFPLQPKKPVIPLAMLTLALYVMRQARRRPPASA